MQTRMIRPLLLAVLLAAPALVRADPPAGHIDPGFGDFNGGIMGLQLEGFNLSFEGRDLAYAMTEDAHRRLLVAGVAQTDTGQCLGLMRFTADGQLDTDGFGYNANQVAKGKICHAVLNPGDSLGYDVDIALLPDGGFLVGGNTSGDHPFVCRFHADGRRFDGFGTDGCSPLPQIDVGSSWPAPAVLPTGTSIFVVSNHDENSFDTPVLARLSLASGMPEPFGQQDTVPLLSGAADAFAWDAVLTDDGDLVLAGRIEVDAGDRDAFVARFDLQQLQPDLQFGGDGMVRFKFNQVPLGHDYMTSIALLPDGDIVASGRLELPSYAGIAVVRLDAASGALSTAFNGGVPRYVDPCPAAPAGCFMRVSNIGYTDKHIVVSGRLDDNMFAARLDLIGGIDTRFGDEGVARFDLDDDGDDGATGMVLQGDRIVLAGSSALTGDSEFALLRLSDGRLFKDQFEPSAP